MQYKTITLEPFYVIGVSVRTTNKAGQSQQDIGALWQRFLSDAIADQIPNKAAAAVYCVYTDYETDADGPYTTILGCRVTSLQTIPEGFTGKEILEANYRVYTPTGKLPEAVLKTWIHIWQTPINRSYTADFDVYGTKAQEPEQAEVEIYLSVR